MENRNRDRESFDKNKNLERESTLPSSPGSESHRGGSQTTDRSTQGDRGSSQVGSPSGPSSSSDRSRSRSDESEMGSPGRDKKLDKER